MPHGGDEGMIVDNDDNDESLQAACLLSGNWKSA